MLARIEEVCGSAMLSSAKSVVTEFIVITAFYLAIGKLILFFSAFYNKSFTLQANKKHH